MDSMYRKGEYQRLLDKLNEIQGSDTRSSEEKYGILQEQVNDLIDSLRSRSDQADARVHYVLLLVPLFLSLLIHSYIFKSYTENIFIIALLAVALILAHLRMGIAIKNSQQTINQANALTNQKQQFILKKLGFLESALDIKKTRLVQVALFYILFFPILLIKLSEISFNIPPFNNITIAYILAYVLGGVFWYYYFNKNFDLYDQVEEEAELIEKNL